MQQQEAPQVGSAWVDPRPPHSWTTWNSCSWAGSSAPSAQSCLLPTGGGTQAYAGRCTLRTRPSTLLLLASGSEIRMVSQLTLQLQATFYIVNCQNSSRQMLLVHLLANAEAHRITLYDQGSSVYMQQISNSASHTTTRTSSARTGPTNTPILCM